MTLYEQVAEQMEGFIAKGIYEPGERLPSTRKLAQRMSASVNTVREAYSFLEQRRTVAARSRSGFSSPISPRDQRPISPQASGRSRRSPRPWVRSRIASVKQWAGRSA